MLRAAGRQIAKRHKKAQRPHGRQSVKKLMAHGENVNSIEVEAPKLFDRMARRFNVDYAFYKTGPDKYLLFFKAGQADAITACFERYSRRLLEQSKSSRIPIREQLKKAAEQLVKEPPKTQERSKEVVREERYLAACIANALMEKEVAVCMTNFATILNDLAASFEGRNEYISRLCSYPLLILDDFGMERGTEYGLEQVYSVIDSRYRSGKPLIATTNLTLEELQHPQDTPHARIYDRLTSMCAPVRFTGSNFRKETAQEKLERLKQLMKQRKESL